MSRPDLYDLAIDNGGLDLIPADLCRDMHVGHKTAWTVLVHRLLYADSTGVMSWGTQTIADKLGLDRIRVREADELLLAAGLMAVVGKRVRGRTTSYRMLPRLLDALTEHHENDPPPREPETPDDDELAAELARRVGTESWHGELARKVGTESVAKKGSEVKRRGTRVRATPQQPPPESPDKNPEQCAIHGDTNPDTPCNGCRRARENRDRNEQKRLQARRQAERDDAWSRQESRRRRDDRDPVTLNDLIPVDIANKPQRERLDWLKRHPVSA